MTCPSTLTCAGCADGALAPEQAAALERHLAGCAGCRARVAAFAAESRALRAAMHAAEPAGVVPAFVPRPTLPKLLSWLAWTTVTMWAVSVGWAGLVRAATPPGWIQWLAPDAVAVGIEFTVGLLLGLVGGSDGAIAGVLESAGTASLVVVGLLAAWLAGRRGHSRHVSLVMLLGAGLLLAAGPRPAQAFVLRHDEVRVTVSAGEVVDDTLVAAGESVLVDGTVTGDLIAMGEEVIVRGRVGGSLVVMAETVTVEGEVMGNVLGMGETVDLRAANLGANVYGIARALTVHPDTRVAGNLALGAAKGEVYGAVGRDLLSFAGHLTLLGSVDGALRAYGEEVDIAESARVGGDVTVTTKSPESFRLADGATLEGAVNASEWPQEPSRYLTFEYYLGETLQLVAAFITGLVLFHLFPGLRRTRMDRGGQVLAVAGIGALLLVATPALALGATITLIGAPIGIVVFLLWLVTLYLAGIVVAGHVGRLLLDDDARGGALPLLLGLVLLFLLINIPFIGGPVKFVAVVMGLGLIGQWLRGLWTQRPA